jgi:hypothetical protein
VITPSSALPPPIRVALHWKRTRRLVGERTELRAYVDGHPALRNPDYHVFCLDSWKRRLRLRQKRPPPISIGSKEEMLALCRRWQKRMRSRVMDDHAPWLLAALSAVSRRSCYAYFPVRFPATTSVVWASPLPRGYVLLYAQRIAPLPHEEVTVTLERTARPYCVSPAVTMAIVSDEARALFGGGW